MMIKNYSSTTTTADEFYSPRFARTRTAIRGGILPAPLNLDRSLSHRWLHIMHCNAYVLTLCFVVWSHALRSTLAIRGDTLRPFKRRGIGRK